ncbi:MAG: cobyrinate a,c-diamide synthase [Propionibacteriaceae bacterium]
MHTARITLSATGSSSGKTTLSMGLMAALRDAGQVVQGFKIGPDYIDPSFHELATGRPGRNLDPHLTSEAHLGPLFAHGMLSPDPADIAVIEGVMGLFDGRIGTRGFGSTAHVAQALQAPVILIVDGSHTSRTSAALAHGLATFDNRLQIAGVIGNFISSERVRAELEEALGDVGLELLGAIPRHGELGLPSRHLGLVPAAERAAAQAAVSAAGRVVADHVNLDRVLALAQAAPELQVEPWNPRDVVTPVTGRPRIAVATGAAFTFRYPENTELLEAAGCEVVSINPLLDQELPHDVAGLYLGGGFPEIYATELAANVNLRASIKRAIAAGLPTVAECAGLLYLCRSLDGIPMADVLPLEARMAPRLTLRYHEPVALADSLVTRAGEAVRAHEFHRTVVEGDSGQAVPAWNLGTLTEGWAQGQHLHASYQHVHWAGYPAFAQRLADAACEFQGTQIPEPLIAQPNPTGVGIDHHGDRDVVEGLTNLSVNVREDGPPAWLRTALQRSLNDIAAYPDPELAQAALAQRHQVPATMVLPTAGGAEAFTLIAQALHPKKPLIVHPQFTEPELALRAAGCTPARHLLKAHEGFVLSPERVENAYDMVFIGNPTNPTSVLHTREALLQLRRPGRILVVDEAFMDAIPGEPESLIGPSMEGILVTRSLTKTWGIPGIRAGYVVGDPALIARLAAVQTAWSVSTPASVAMRACSTPEALDEATAWTLSLSEQRRALTDALTAHGIAFVARPRAPFVLIDTSSMSPHSLREPLLRQGFAVRRCDSFPGLGPTWIRVAVRTPEVTDRFIAALTCLTRKEPLA